MQRYSLGALRPDGGYDGHGSTRTTEPDAMPCGERVGSFALGLWERLSQRNAECFVRDDLGFAEQASRTAVMLF